MFFYDLGLSPFSYNLVREIENKLNGNTNNIFLLLSIYNCNSYMLADTLDFILFDFKNPRRKRYFLHHLLAILGTSSVFWGNFTPIIPIFYLEIGGLVHHLRTICQSYEKFLIPSTIIYFIIYGYSRLFLFLTNNVYFMTVENPSYNNYVNISVVYLLCIQNMVWFVENIRKIFK